MIDPKKFGRVAVLCGGETEREISLKSGKAVLHALLENGVDAFNIDPRDDLEMLKKAEFDRAYIVLHGGQGENGEIQGFLKALNIPFTGCETLTCAITMDKVISKRIWRDAGLPVLPWVEMTSLSQKEEAIEKLGLPLVLKPLSGGSSLGVSKVETLETFEAAYLLAREYESIVLAEPWISGRELTLPVIDGEVFPIIEIIPSDQHEFYDYAAKYTDPDTKFACPCDITDTLRARINEIALAAYYTTRCRGMVRVDFRLDENDEPWLFEINTVPGYTSTSLVPRSVQVAGMGFPSLVMKVLLATL